MLGLLLLMVVVLASPAAAIQIAAVYTAACVRDVGVILHADADAIRLLTLEGLVLTRPRHEIVYLAYYPLGDPPVARVENPQEAPVVTVYTQVDGEIVELASGWMIDYSDQEISFLSVHGGEGLVRIDDIWDIGVRTESEPLRLNGATAAYTFAQPYPFRLCPDGGAAQFAAGAGGSAGAARQIFPNQIFSGPVVIKAELDRLQEGHERLQRYQDSKVFYPVPQLYTNDTRLGLWLNAGGRHGVSNTRSASLTPLLVNEQSEGPFGFQSVWLAGAAPMPYSVHEELQTQLYYRLKVDYVHFSINYDLSRALIGERRYKWHRQELNSQDERWNEIFHVAGGFDYGRLAGDLSLTQVQYAFRYDQLFFTNRTELLKLGLFYQDRHRKLEFYYGTAADEKPGVQEVARSNDDEDIAEAEEELARVQDFHTKLTLYRVNVDFPESRFSGLHFSLIYRSSDFTRDPTATGENGLRFAGESWTLASYWRVPLQQDLGLTGMLAVEAASSRAGETALTHSHAQTFPKAGISLELNL